MSGQFIQQPRSGIRPGFVFCARRRSKGRVYLPLLMGSWSGSGEEKTNKNDLPDIHTSHDPCAVQILFAGSMYLSQAYAEWRTVRHLCTSGPLMTICASRGVESRIFDSANEDLKPITSEIMRWHFGQLRASPYTGRWCCCCFC